jgi:allophanate hydrolase subunit 1
LYRVDVHSDPDAILPQKPHAFQQKLSAEATPALQDAIPSFEKLVQVWKRHQAQHPETANIVAAGLDKIEAYSARASCVDAYTLAMGEPNHLFL